MSKRGFDGSTDVRAVAYLTQRGVWVPGARHTENMQRCFDAVKLWAKPSPRADKQWAHDVLAEHEAGRYAPMAAVKLAMEVLGMEKAPMRVPRRTGPKPDAAERAAGDVPEPDTVEERW